MKRLSEEAIAKILHNVPGTKLKFESKLTDQDMLAFMDEMRIELRAIARAAEDEILRQVREFLEGNYKRKDSVELECFIQALRGE